MTPKKYKPSLVLDLKRFFSEKAIAKPIGWMAKHGIDYTTANKLLHGKFKRNLPMNHINMICEKLWCTPNDLFAFHPSAEQDIPNHPLQELKREEEVLDMSKALLELPPAKLKEFENMLKKLKEEA